MAIATNAPQFLQFGAGLETNFTHFSLVRCGCRRTRTAYCRRAAVPAAVIQDHQEVIQITVHPTILEAVHPAVPEAAMHQVHQAVVPVLNHQAVHPDQKVGTTLGQPEA